MPMGANERLKMELVKLEKSGVPIFWIREWNYEDVVESATTTIRGLNGARLQNEQEIENLKRNLSHSKDAADIGFWIAGAGIVFALLALFWK